MLVLVSCLGEKIYNLVVVDGEWLVQMYSAHKIKKKQGVKNNNIAADSASIGEKNYWT